MMMMMMVMAVIVKMVMMLYHDPHATARGCRKVGRSQVCPGDRQKRDERVWRRGRYYKPAPERITTHDTLDIFAATLSQMFPALGEAACDALSAVLFITLPWLQGVTTDTAALPVSLVNVSKKQFLAALIRGVGQDCRPALAYQTFHQLWRTSPAHNEISGQTLTSDNRRYMSLGGDYAIPVLDASPVHLKDSLLATLGLMLKKLITIRPHLPYRCHATCSQAAPDGRRRRDEEKSRIAR